MANETILNNRYKLVAQQGSGGMAVIYKAQDLSLGRTVAIKILRPTLTNDPSFLARFRNEARSVANLTHPNIVTIHDFGSEGSTHYIVMEFVEGQDLKKVIKAEGALPIDRALNFAIQIAAGIGFAHRAGLVHADVKPQNILVKGDDVLKVTDFGIAQALSDAQPNERQAVVWGSPHYFAPEQARGERPTPASDVYAIGIVMFEMLTGRLPFSGNNQQELALAHIREPIPMVTDFNPAIPESVARIVYKTMSKDPTQRYRMADQLGHILSGYRDRGREHTVSNPAIQQRMPPTSAPTVQSNYPAPPVSRPPYTDGTSTQRYDLAPSAPPVMQNRSGATVYPATPQPPASGGNTSQYYTPYPSSEYKAPPPPLDVVTIALAVLAFFAVACLIPLYIAVFQARFGG
jgi:eukaryotic-like serine/threonine-protein kinase